MHLIPDLSNTDEVIVFEALFCPMQRLNSQTFYDKWKQVNKKFEQRFSMGKLFTNREASVIKRLQANNIIVCSFKTSENVTALYLSCTTKDNILILMEMILTNNDVLSGSVKYKSERMTRESDLENFLAMILSESDLIEKEDVYCR